MNTGTPARILLGAACLVGLIAAVAVLTGAVRVGDDGPVVDPPAAAAATPPAPVAPDGVLPPDPRGGVPATVLAVADPVTIDVRLEDGRVLRVRALGVQPPDRCYADQALQFARGTLAGQAVTLAGDGRADRFSRALAWVSLSTGDYAVLAAEAGVVSTYAADAPPERMPAVRAAADRARVAGRGLWGPPCVGAGAATTAPSKSSSRPAASALSRTPG
ncbi:thermonuclease family protein [Actinomycetospora endophytica]|uniref:Thermonuclease family protein n=1 Tax=Actinomycetospora endophytica TaxID=2291215 RepID=A0ABS8PEU9_9PSEU|nr:thermonuclease family protein [Actinomycetospora endophytica]MCD2196025.1 thermonuclease family protein [Actinomycetospora endophytica]